MKHRWVGIVVVLAAVLALVPVAVAFDRERFAHPPSDSRPAVLWFWNGEVTPALVDRQLADLRAQGVDEVLVFPFETSELRPRFFSEEWFAIIEHTLREAQRQGMHLWLFNDDFFPSGRGGGFVVNGGRVGDREYPPRPDARAKGVQRGGTRTVAGGRSVEVRDLLSAGGLLVRDGRLVVDATARRGVTLLREGAEWTDYTVTSTVRVERSTAGVMVRSTDERNGYLADMGRNGAVSVWRQTDGAFTLLDPGAARPGFDPDVDHELQVRVQGDEISVSLDGQLANSVRDATYSRGRVGVRAVADQRALHDALRVTAADGAELFAETFDTDAALAAFDIPVPLDRLAAVAARPVGSSDPDAIVDLTERARDGRRWDVPAGDWRVDTYAYDLLADDGGFRRYYLDTLDDETVGRFLDTVPGEYYRRFPWAFGTVLRGFADDEPFISSADAHFGGVPWSPALPDALRRHGTTPAAALSAVHDDLGRDGERLRGRFWRATSDRFAEAYYRQQHRWMAQHGVEFISNPLWDENGPAEQVKSSGNVDALHQWSQIPGTDVVFDFRQPYHWILPRYAASAAHQLGLPLVYNEAMGAFGWHVTPGDTRHVTGAFAVRGVNFTLLHAAWTNQRNIFYPPPFDAANPWWRVARPMNEWIGRVMELGRAEAEAPTALLQPQRAAEAAQDTPAVEEIDSAFGVAARSLEFSQVDFDLLDEGALTGDPVLRAHASVDDGVLRVGRMRYRVVVLPETPALSLEAARVLEWFVRSGGMVVAAGPLPSREVDGRDSALREVLGRLDGPRVVRLGNPIGAGRAVAGFGLAAATVRPSTDAVRVLRLRGGFVVVNESDSAVETTATFPASGAPDVWDPETGRVSGVSNYRIEEDGVAVPLRLEPREVVGLTFGGEVGPHAVESNAPVVVVKEAGRGLRATVRATRPGPITVFARDGRRSFSGTAVIEDGLSPVSLDGDWRVRIERSGGVDLARPLGSWTDLDAAHSGTALYERVFDVSAETLAGRRWTLDLGGVRDTAEVTINGREFPPRLWTPYRLDVTDALRAGANSIAVRVTNTLANAHGDARPSGLLGPVRLLPERLVEVPLSPANGERALVIEPAAPLRLAPGQERRVSLAVRDLHGRPGHVRLDAEASGPLRVTPRADVQLGRDGVGTARLTLSAPLEASAPGTAELRLRGQGVSAVLPVRIELATRLGRAWALSTTSPWSAERVIDGKGTVTSAEWSRGEGWNDGTLRAFPDVLTVAWEDPAPVSRVRVSTLDTPDWPAADWGVRDVDVLLERDGGWQTVAELRGNRAGTAEVSFPRQPATGVRLVIRDAGQDYSRVIEVEAVP